MTMLSFFKPDVACLERKVLHDRQHLQAEEEPGGVAGPARHHQRQQRP
jgi:hypothetical protein